VADHAAVAVASAADRIAVAVVADHTVAVVDHRTAEAVAALTVAAAITNSNIL